MATVFRASDPQLDRDVALKIISDKLSIDDKFVQRFQREARIVAQIDHPQIVSIYDSGQYDDRPYIVMQLLTEGTLRQKINLGALPVSAVVSILLQATDALHAAHSKGIVHRDIKPSNILFDRRGSVLISDFGIAKITGSDSNLTGTHMIGTPIYMSPEQFRGGDVDARSDQYSLAVVAYEALCGRPPFEGEMITLAYKHVHEPHPPLKEKAIHVPFDLVEILDRALSKEPEERFPDLQAMHQALQALDITRSGVVSSPYPTPLPSPVTPPPSSSIEFNYESGVRAVESAQWDTARVHLSRVYNEDPGYKQVSKLLQKAESELGTKVEIPPPPPESVATEVILEPLLPQPKKRRMGWPVWVGAAILALLLLGGGGYFLAPSLFAGRSPTPTAAPAVGVDPTATAEPQATATPELPPAETAAPSTATAVFATDTPLPTMTPFMTSTPAPTRATDNERDARPTAGPSPTLEGDGALGNERGGERNP